MWAAHFRVSGFRGIGCLLVGWYCAAGVAQRALEPDERTPAGALPASNEAKLRLDQARHAVEQGDYRLAIALIDGVLEHGDDLVLSPPGRTYYPVWRQAARLLEALPPEGLELYRQLHDAEVVAQLTEAAAHGEITALRRLFQTRRGSSAWPLVGRELIAQLFEAGRFAEALGVLRLSSATGPAENFGHRAQRVAALVGVGSFAAAERALAELDSDAVAGWPADAEERLEALRAYLAASRRSADPQGLAADPGDRPPFEPIWRAELAWEVPLEPAGPPAAYDDDNAIADAVERLGALPLQGTVYDDGVLVARLRGTLAAYDALTLTPLWRVGELTSTAPRSTGAGGMTVAAAARLIGEGEEPALSSDTGTLLSHTLRHSVTTGFGLVFTIESLPAVPLAVWPGPGLNLADLNSASAGNELVARELATGRLVWRAGGDPDEPLYGVAFQDRPAVVGSRLALAYARRDSLYLGLLEPETGRLVQEVAVIQPPTYFSPIGGRCLVAVDEASIYVCTGNGVVAAFGREDLAWQWASVYPSTLGERRLSDPWALRQRSADLGSARPVVVDDALVLAPADCPFLFALDRLTGRQRWRSERRDHAWLVGAVDGGVIVGHDALTCLDAADGTTIRWRSVPLAMTGHAVLRGECLFVPTRAGVVGVDVRTGKVISDGGVVWPQGSGRGYRLDAGSGPAAANLVCTPDALVAISPNRVVKYADPQCTRQMARWLLGGATDALSEDRARLALAWADGLEGGHAQVLAALESWAPAEPALASGRQRLLGDVLLALARRATDAEQRLVWLRRAADISLGGDAGLRVATMTGRALEETEAWPQAAEHYLELIRGGVKGTVSAGDDPPREIAAWLYAAGRLDAALDHLDATRSAGLMETAVTGAEPETLLHLRVGVADPWRIRIDRLLALTTLPPELLTDYLPAEIDGSLPVAEQRRLLLARWDAHVALGQVDQASADERDWERRFASQTPKFDDDAAAGDEARRARRIQAALRELSETPEVPWRGDGDLVRQWKLSQGELVLDSSAGRPRRDSRPTVPADRPEGKFICVRNLEDRVLALHSAVEGREWRRTADALRNTPSGTEAGHSDADLYGDTTHGEAAATRAAWPALVWGHRAAVPVRGGLVGVGLGPARGGGQRWWEYPVPEWSEVRDELGDTAVAGPFGVYVLRRNDRVAMIGWDDGQLWWQLDLADVRPRQLLHFLMGEPSAARLQHASGSCLIVVGQDGTILSLDALFGEALAKRPPGAEMPAEYSGAAGSGAWRKAMAIGRTLVVWGDDGIMGVAPDTLMPRWVRAAPEAPGNPRSSPRPAAGCHAIQPGTWVAYRSLGAPDWTILDAETGTEVFERRLELGDEVRAVVVDRGEPNGIGEGARRPAILAASLASDGVEAASGALVRFCAFDATDGHERWSTDIQTLAWVNASQLLASPEYIPVLLAGDRDEFTDGVGYRALALQLVDKSTGDPGKTIPLTDDFRNGSGFCAAYLLATPSRIIVQANGDLVAYGAASGTRLP